MKDLRIDDLAGSLTADDFDITEVYENIAALLTRRQTIQLGAALELCPIHFCDIAICIDDDVHGNEVYSTGGN